MAETKVLSNQHVAFFLGPATAIADYTKPTLAEFASLTNVSEAVKWDGTNFAVDASDLGDSRSLTDAAGAQSRSYSSFGGDVEGFTPKPTDTTSILRTTRTMLKTPRTKLALGIRVITPATDTAAAGDEVSVFRVITDAERHNRSDTDYSYTATLEAQDDVGVNRILPSASPTAVALTPATAVVTTVGTIGYHKASYEGRNVTIGATYTSSDESVVLPFAGGWVAVGVGSATITPSFPGSAVGTPKSFTVS